MLLNYIRIVLLFQCLLFAFAGIISSPDGTKRRVTERLMDKLFPNRTTIFNTDGKHALRKLPIDKTPYDPADPVTCVTCNDLNYCSIVNGNLVQEVYYPDNPEFLESCHVLESLGKRMYAEVFGNGRTFRDTPQCRDIVMQYLCLFYGSNNGMYKNYCVYQEKYDGPQTNWLLAPRAPCKSFCVQVARVCANEIDFIQTCEEMVCPQPLDSIVKYGECNADPFFQNSPLGVGGQMGCNVPYYQDPYAPKAGAATAHGREWVWLSAALGGVALLVLM